jgi:hypothetical protein
MSMATAQAASESKLNALSLEFGKTGLIYNLSFDRKLKTSHWGFRLTVGNNPARYLIANTAGGGIYRLIGTSNHFIELGAEMQYFRVIEVSDDQRGFSLLYPDFPVRALYPSVNVGYRRQGNTTLFRLGFSPGVIIGEFVPGGYLSYGFRF